LIKKAYSKERRKKEIAVVINRKKLVSSWWFLKLNKPLKNIKRSAERKIKVHTHKNTDVD